MAKLHSKSAFPRANALARAVALTAAAGFLCDGGVAGGASQGKHPLEVGKAPRKQVDGK